MKKIIFIVLLWSNHISAGVLSCNAWLADSLIGEMISGNDIVLSAVGTGGTADIEHWIEITMPHIMSEILDGSDLTWHLFVNGNLVDTVHAVRITAGTTFYSNKLFAAAGPTRIELRTPSRGLPPVVTPDRTVRAGIQHHYRLANGQIISATAPTLYITSTNETVDSITLPDRLDLGSLNVGYNSSDIPVDYQVNTNSIGLKFSQTSTTGSRLTVNDTIPTAEETYTPPLNFGLYISGNNPGTYTSTVTATWTCP